LALDEEVVNLSLDVEVVCGVWGDRGCAAERKKSQKCRFRRLPMKSLPRPLSMLIGQSRQS
jgi:hypothetical protein